MGNNIVLYSFELSANSQKVRILLSALGLNYQTESIDIPNGEHKQPAFLAINPRGQVPSLTDDSVKISDSHAILVYLAHRYDKDSRFLPSDEVLKAEVQSWLSFSANELQNTLHIARLHFLLNVPADVEQLQVAGRQALAYLETELGGRDWLVGDAVTIADIACAPMVALAGDAKVDLKAYSAVREWLTRFEKQEFFTPLG